MSQEIITVLEYIGEKLGIAIDWTAENVMPQVLAVLSRYRILEIVERREARVLYCCQRHHLQEREEYGDL